MASVASASPPPGFHHSYPHAGSADGSDSSWQHVESNPASVGFIPSPASSSMNSWSLVGYPTRLQLPPSPSALSPLRLDYDLEHLRDPYPAPPPPHHHKLSYSGPLPPSYSASASLMATTGVEGDLMPAFDEGNQLMADPAFMFAQPVTTAADMASYHPHYFSQADIDAMSGLQGLEMAAPSMDMGLSSSYQNTSHVAPWPPASMGGDGLGSIVVGGVHGYMSHSPSQRSAHSSHHTPSPPRMHPDTAGSAAPIRRVRPGSRVEKRKTPTDMSKFVIMTPNLISQQSGRPNPFECFEAMRTQRGRKGPLANDTKESALEVRRLGACFCCHSRKVKCDKERPCKNCRKLTALLPQIICWQFADFLPVLFPDFIRGHFKREQVASFLGENVESFKVNGIGQVCSVEMFSGPRFKSTLTIPASFFTPKTAEILQHWHATSPKGRLHLHPRGAAPIGIDPDNFSHREELKQKLREYVQQLTQEPMYAEQVTDSVRSTQLPCKLLAIVQQYAQRSGSPMVKRALSIHVMHYVLTRQLCLTGATVAKLRHTGRMPEGNPWPTTRVLNRQVKALLDEMLLREVQALFDGLGRALKPKSRREWAPCLAAFLVLCLFMETVETAADTFVLSQNELLSAHHLGGGGGGGAGGSGGFSSSPPPPGLIPRAFALAVCKEIDNMPFKQVAYQFHQVYQTHTRDGAVRAFNPLLAPAPDHDQPPPHHHRHHYQHQHHAGPSAAEQRERQQQLEELLRDDAPAAELATDLRGLLSGDGRQELSFLAADPVVLPPVPPYEEGGGGATLDYTGRLVARFLLSFEEERYLFDGQF